VAGTLPSGRDGPHVFVDDLEHPRLADGDRHHLERVLRVRPGDPITVSDGRGRWRPGRMGPELEPAGEVVVVDPPSPTLTVAFALTKGERPELAVQKLTELGVDRIAPFTAARSIVRWDDARAERHVERLRRVAREAAMQCRRVHLPEVAAPAGFATVAALPGAALAERGGRPPDLGHPTVLVGPEGGWDDAELAAGLPTVHLGPHLLRAETAAIAAGALLVALRSATVRPI
jgi:16S rRNA (uracil1498-N3)-methyltransferase